jgi:predicted glycogen debranching enzyme
MDFKTGVSSEYLETNGLGGWAGSTLIGCNTRRYHGLLVASTLPPIERMLLVSKLDETVLINNNRFELGVNNYGSTLNPQGHEYLTSFSKEIFPTFIYEVGSVTLKKTIAAVHNENTTLITYDVLKAPSQFDLELLLLIASRSYHSLTHANNAINQDTSFGNGIFYVQAYNNTPEIYISVPNSSYHHNPHWYYNFYYSEENFRGLDYIEDLFSHGHFSVSQTEGDSLGIIISTNNPLNRNAQQLLAAERWRREKMIGTGSPKNILQILTLAADQFIVQRSPLPASPASSSSPVGGGPEGAGLSILAGYHWFTDWGRDAMIALPGICLSTGRYEDAKKILTSFAGAVDQGMIPNRFPDDNQPPEYNTVDASLWFFVTVWRYLQATNDHQFVLANMLPVMKQIIVWHSKGTRYNIRVEDDGLLYSGQEGVQLTWMDAKVNDEVITPRMGRPVEIQALWYNAICIFAKLLQLNNDLEKANMVQRVSERTKQSFNAIFWNSQGNYLYDVIDQNNKPDASIRPNQLFAISLPFTLIDDAQKATAILSIVTEQLYTPPGLRSLSPKDPAYIGDYGGGQYRRDSSYHQGTVWSWLLGPYIDSLLRTGGTKEQAQAVINGFKYHLDEACIGTVSEIFNGNPPHYPRGCIAQAWGVAEVLRVIQEYGL